MKYVKCNFCGSESFKIWGVSVKPNSLHNIQVRCRKCGLFYSNPRATNDELKKYYSDYYTNKNNFHSDYLRKENQTVIIKLTELNLSRLTGGARQIAPEDF